MTTNKTENPLITISSYIEGTRFHGIPSFLETLAFRLDCDIKYRSEKGWIKEIVFYKVTGIRSNIELFRKHVLKTIIDHNS